MSGLRRCTRCLLPETFPGIAFGDDGICNFCPRGDVAPTPATLGREALVAAIAERSASSRYDCLVAFSGGRDSSYVLYYASRVLGLRVQAFTIDNGFMPQATIDNIDRAVRILGVDHVVERHNLVVKTVRRLLPAWLRKPSAAMVSLFCTGCRLGLQRGFIHATRAAHTPVVLSGLGEPEQGFAMQLLGAGRPVVRGMIKGLCGELLSNPSYLLERPSLLWWIYLEYLYAGNLYGISRFTPVKCLLSPGMRHVKFFEYVPWREDHIVSTIEAELGWRNWQESVSSWRSDCKISLLKNALYLATLGFTKNDVLVSNLVRLGVMSRDKGLARVERENLAYEPFLESFLPEFGITYGVYRDAMRMAGFG